VRPVRLRNFAWLLAALCLPCAQAAAANLDFTVATSEPVVVTGVPRIAIDVGGVTRYATYASGTGTSSLTFAYAVQPGDFDANGITLAAPLELNGGNIADSAGNLVSPLTFTLPDTSAIKVQTYTASFTTSPITSANANAVSFAIAKAPTGASFTYTITSSGGAGTVSGSGTIAGASHTVSSVDVSALPSGTLTLSVTVTTAAGGTGAVRSATSTPSFAGALDSLSPAAAFSVRRVASSYTGPLLRVRRSSDSMEQDIGATIAGNLNTSALASFCGSGSCYVRTWYDQSGNGRHAVQATASAQPGLVNAGVIETHNGLPALYFNATNYNLDSATPFTTSYSLLAVASRSATTASATSYRRLLNVGGSLGNRYAFLGLHNAIYTTFAGIGPTTWNDISPNTPAVSVPANTPVTMAVTIGLNVLTPYINGSAQDTKNGATASVTGINIGGLLTVSGAYLFNQMWDGRVSEMFVYGYSLGASNVQVLQANQKTYYGTP